jgi:hypothetical protein
MTAADIMLVPVLKMAIASALFMIMTSFGLWLGRVNLMGRENQ